MRTMGILRNLQVSCGCGYECCGNTAWMDLTVAGFPHGWILLWREPHIEPFTQYNDYITNALTGIDTYESVMYV